MLDWIVRERGPTDSPGLIIWNPVFEVSPIALVDDIAKSADKFHFSLVNIIIHSQWVLGDLMGESGVFWIRKRSSKKIAPLVRRSSLAQMVRMCVISPSVAEISTVTVGAHSVFAVARAPSGTACGL